MRFQFETLMKLADELMERDRKQVQESWRRRRGLGMSTKLRVCLG